VKTKKTPVIAMVTEAVELFKQHHGVKPTELVAEQAALIAVVHYEGKLGLKGLPVRVVPEMAREKLRGPGKGRALALFLVDLADGRLSAAVTEYDEAKSQA
jgi:hypothetical protein